MATATSCMPRTTAIVGGSAVGGVSAATALVDAGERCTHTHALIFK